MMWWEEIAHRLGFHTRESFCENIYAERGGIFTIGGWQCRRCGRSRLLFIYHS